MKIMNNEVDVDHLLLLIEQDFTDNDEDFIIMVRGNTRTKTVIVLKKGSKEGLSEGIYNMGLYGLRNEIISAADYLKKTGEN